MLSVGRRIGLGFWLMAGLSDTHTSHELDSNSGGRRVTAIKTHVEPTATDDPQRAAWVDALWKRYGHGQRTP